eukprot:scaffold2607_cov118-Isochrysis_galbana.AAC.5
MCNSGTSRGPNAHNVGRRTESAPAVPARPSARRPTWPHGPRRPTELRGPPSRAAFGPKKDANFRSA